MSPDPRPPADVAIVSLAAQDAGELLTLQRAAYTTEARRYGDPELSALTQTLSELQQELASVTARKATAGHRLVGAVRAHVDGTVLHIGRLMVAPDWQGRGVGSRLLAAVEEHHGDHVNTAALFTGHLSAANLALYARRGYLERRREQLRPGVVLVHLTKALRAAGGPAT